VSLIVTSALYAVEAFEPTAVRSASPPLKVTPLFDIAEAETFTLPVASVASTFVKPEFDVRLTSGKLAKCEIWRKKHEVIAGYFKSVLL